MKNIGESIQEAIDWTQDHLTTTRPLAEQTLFSLILEHKVRETEEGFVLMEAEDEIEKHLNKIKSTMTQNRKHFRFHSKRKNKITQQRKKLDNSSAAEDMIAADEAFDVADADGLV